MANTKIIIKKIPGFRSGKWWKTLIASTFYLLTFLILLLELFPPAPTLALEKIEPTNKNTISIIGTTYSNKPIYLLKDNEIIQSIKSDSNGKFYFALNDLADGNYIYAVEACNSEKKDKCKSENILVVVDQTPPAKPVIALPDKLPDDSEEEIAIKGVSEPNTKIIVSVQDNELLTTTTNNKGEFEIKTGLVLGTNTINVKAVDNVGNESEVGGASLNFNPSKYKAKVIRVIDGDTVEIENGQTIRYIGINTPETVHPSKPVECYGKEASNENKELVEGKEVKLEKDISETDKYGRFLRYIWLDDMLVNEYLVREGYAQSSSYPPDIKYQDRFLEAQRQAREEKKGLWGDICNAQQVQTSQQTQQQSTTSTQNTQSTITQITPSVQPQTQPPSQTSGNYTCDCSKNCSQMASCEEAYFQLNDCGCLQRDGDKDGVPCESICSGG